ncbi:MAG: VPLPA-CTERM sorting domain-containing protein [Pseudomonadota bacterium]
MRKNTLFSMALAAALALPGASFAATVVNFDDGSEGNLNGTEVFSGLVEVDGNGKTLGLYNSNCNGNGSTQFGVSCTGGDPDLASGTAFGTDPQGLVLIIEENPGDSTPDDDRRGGTISFSFAQAVVMNAITLLDLDRDFTNIMLTFFFEGGGVLSTGLNGADAVTLLGSETGDNSLRRYDFSGLAPITGFDFKTTDSGAIASLEVTPVPLPAAGWLLIGGLGGLVAMKRRKAKAQA